MTTKKRSKDMVYWCIPVTKQLDISVEDAVKQGLYITKSDLVRSAVRTILKQFTK